MFSDLSSTISFVSFLRFCFLFFFPVVLFVSNNFIFRRSMSMKCIRISISSYRDKAMSHSADFRREFLSRAKARRKKKKQKTRRLIQIVASDKLSHSRGEKWEEKLISKLTSLLSYHRFYIEAREQIKLVKANASF